VSNLHRCGVKIFEKVCDSLKRKLALWLAGCSVSLLETGWLEIYHRHIEPSGFILSVFPFCKKYWWGGRCLSLVYAAASDHVVAADSQLLLFERRLSCD
jgi:hypothetical protein